MKVPINWLKQYVEIAQPASQIASILTSIGHMQDGPIQKVKGGLVIDIEIRQNRPDCLSIVGVARELAAATNVKIQYPQIENTATFSPKGNWKIVVEDASLCFRFNTIKIDNIKVGKSPEWLKALLEFCGMESINNVVDITNYVMIEFGQPLHAFDANLITGDIVIRQARQNEKFTALGEKKLILTTDDLVIADAEKILALSGVIGSSTEGVNSETKSIILEGATYNQASIRRTSLRHAIRTEASTRLGKFLHPQLTSVALCRSAYLLKETCGAKVVASVDYYPKIFEIASLELSTDRILKLGGVKIDNIKISQILQALGFEVRGRSANKLTVLIPYFRTDVLCEEDLVEEVLRMYGYDKIPSVLPNSAPSQDIQSRYFELEEKIRDIMTSLGFDEHITEPLTTETVSNKIPIILQNSLTSEKSMLRTTLQHSLEKVLVNYQKHRRLITKIFEIGKIFFDIGGFKEQRTLGVIFSSSSAQYKEIKGIITTLISQLGKEIHQSDYFIVPIDRHVWYAEVNIDSVFGRGNIDTFSVFTSPPLVVFQDLSLVAPVEARVGEVLDTIRKVDKRIFEVELGEEPKIIDNQNKTLFIKFSLRNQNDSNVSKKDIDDLRQQILNKLKKNFLISLSSKA